jgi:hypothetical protein
VNLERRRIEKIFTQINKIGSKGRDNELEYKKYVDDCSKRRLRQLTTMFILLL